MYYNTTSQFVLINRTRQYVKSKEAVAQIGDDTFCIL